MTNELAAPRLTLPISSHDQVKPELESLLSRLHVLIVGPGLGREDYMQKFARLAVSLARERQMYLVLDADALFMIGKDTKLIQGYHKVVITPNVMEFKRLSEQLVKLFFSQNLQLYSTYV